MQKLVYITVLTAFLFQACTDKVICPAFQSTYILDDSIRLAYYSPFEGDSIPKEQPWVRKDKHGIAKKEWLMVKNYKLKTAPMENVLAPPQEDSVIVEEGEFVAEDFVEGDSLGITDELPVALQEEEKEQKYRFKYDPADNFNVDQEYYNKYFGELFIDDTPDPEPEVEEEGQDIGEDLSESDTTSTKKKFGLGMFKKDKDKKKKKDKNADLSELEEEEGNL